MHVCGRACKLTYTIACLKNYERRSRVVSEANELAKTHDTTHRARKPPVGCDVMRWQSSVENEFERGSCTAEPAGTVAVQTPKHDIDGVHASTPSQNKSSHTTDC
jgi:hypothetical protein